MKILQLTLLGFCLATSLPAQGPADDLPITKRTAAELDELLGPIALYPDALISLILPGSTAPMDIVLAARFVASDGDPARTEDKPWDSSVKALTRYPDTLKWLDENLEWTAQVGDAFIQQPVEVMESIQHLRTMARALGNLVDTPQQRIVLDDIYIRIIPAQPDYIYEPRYDPEVIYYERPISAPLLFFSIAYSVGSWLSYDCDWHRHRLYRGDWQGGWDYHRDNDRRDREDYYYINNNFTNTRQWQPDPVRHRRQSSYVSERISNDVNSLSRTQSRDSRVGEPLTADSRSSVEGRTQSSDLGVNEPRKRHAGIARPNPIAGAPNHREGAKQREENERGKVKNEPSARTAQENKPGDGSKGRVTMPNSVAPGTVDEKSKAGKESAARTAQENKPGDGSKGRVAIPNSVAPGTVDDSKRGSDARDPKKPGNDPASVTSRGEAPSKKEAEAKANGKSDKDKATSYELLRKESPKQDAPRQLVPRQSPPQQEAPKREEPKREEPKREVQKQVAPQQVVVPRQSPPKQELQKQVAPKREEPKSEAKKQDAPKQDTPKRPEAAKREAPKPEVAKTPAELVQDKAKTDAKKKDEDKEKKKK